MRWESGRRSDNVEDRRGFHVSRRAAGGGIGSIGQCNTFQTADRGK
jgi:hypothetical protein